MLLAEMELILTMFYVLLGSLYNNIYNHIQYDTVLEYIRFYLLVTG